MTFRGSFGIIIDDQAVDGWHVKMEARVQNNLGQWSNQPAYGDSNQMDRAWNFRRADVGSGGGP